MDDTDKMCVYEGYNKARDCRVETLVKHEVHRYLSTSEWINAARLKKPVSSNRNSNSSLFPIKNTQLKSIHTMAHQQLQKMPLF